MKLLKRFFYFGMGLFVGSIFVWFIWEKKDVQFDYMPNARVLKNIRTDVRLFSNEATNNMTTIGLDSIDISSILKNGNVDFGESSPREKPCKIYVVNGKTKKKNIKLTIIKCDTVSTIDKVNLKSN